MISIVLLSHVLLFQAQVQNHYPFVGYWTADGERSIVRDVERYHCRLKETESWELTVNPDDSHQHELTFSKDESPESKEAPSACYTDLVLGLEVKIKILEFELKDKDTYQFTGRIRACHGCESDGPISRGQDVNGTIKRQGPRRI